MDTASVDHICNVIRRQVLEEFPGLTLFYLAHQEDRAARALQAKAAEIKRHPAGKILYDHLEKLLTEGNKLPEFVGICTRKEENFLSFIAKDQTMAFLLINANDFETLEDVRLHAAALAWQALYIHDEMRYAAPEEKAKLSEGIYAPQRTPNGTLYHNMLGDVFAAILLEIQGYKGSIQKLARTRALASLMPQTKFDPELYPFLLALEATQVVYGDLGASIQKTKPFRQAISLTQEIGHTFDESAMGQWQVFSSAAQEMAWMGVNKTKILGTAVYTSEDPYVRATAYIVAQALNIEPPMVSDLDVFNPFSDQEVNERSHNRSCETAYQDAAAKAASKNDSLCFIKAAHKQNRDLLEGKAIGWCAYGLLRAADAFEAAEMKTRDSMEEAHQVFTKACQETPWPAVRAMNQIIVGLRRNGKDATPETIIDFAKSDDSLYAFVHAFSISIEQQQAPPGEEEDLGEEKGHKKAAF